MYLEYSEPVTFPPDMDPVELDREVARRLHVDPDELPPPRFSFGFRMAEGLPHYLWACPKCMCIDGLAVNPKDRNQVVCRSCGEAWEVDITQYLNPLSPGGERLSVPKAYDRITAHYGDPPVEDEARYQAEGVVLESGPARIRTARGEPESPIDVQGCLQLTPEELRVIDQAGTVVWRHLLRTMMVVSVEGSENLTIRLRDQVLAVDTGGESRMKWAHFMKAYRERSLAESQVAQAE